MLYNRVSDVSTVKVELPKVVRSQRLTVIHPFYFFDCVQRIVGGVQEMGRVVGT